MRGIVEGVNNTPPGKPSFSFEFFPPKTPAAEQSFRATLGELAALKPAFVTMTYGAGGTTRDLTVDLAMAMRRDTGIPAAAHLTCIVTPKDEIAAIAARLWDGDVRHVVTLRGDAPKDIAPPAPDDPRYYHFSSDFVEGLLALRPFEISVAAYPEKHPAAPSLAADIEALRKKCGAGATRAITQFFFDNDTYFRFMDKVRAAGIETPVVPGLLPVGDFEKMCGFAKACGASVPGWMHEKFATTNDHAAVAADLLAAQIEGLTAAGVPHIHLYTLNRADLICAALGIIK